MNYMEYWLVLVNFGYGPDEVPPLAWILIVWNDNSLVMDHMECIIGKYVYQSWILVTIGIILVIDQMELH